MCSSTGKSLTSSYRAPVHLLRNKSARYLHQKKMIANNWTLMLLRNEWLVIVVFGLHMAPLKVIHDN